MSFGTPSALSTDSFPAFSGFRAINHGATKVSLAKASGVKQSVNSQITIANGSDRDILTNGRARRHATHPQQPPYPFNHKPGLPSQFLDAEKNDSLEEKQDGPPEPSIAPSPLRKPQNRFSHTAIDASRLKDLSRLYESIDKWRQAKGHEHPLPCAVEKQNSKYIDRNHVSQKLVDWKRADRKEVINVTLEQVEGRVDGKNYVLVAKGPPYGPFIIEFRRKGQSSVQGEVSHFIWYGLDGDEEGFETSPSVIKVTRGTPTPSPAIPRSRQLERTAMVTSADATTPLASPKSIAFLCPTARAPKFPSHTSDDPRRRPGNISMGRISAVGPGMDSNKPLKSSVELVDTGSSSSLGPTGSPLDPSLHILLDKWLEQHKGQSPTCAISYKHDPMIGKRRPARFYRADDLNGEPLDVAQYKILSPLDKPYVVVVAGHQQPTAFITPPDPKVHKCDLDNRDSRCYYIWRPHKGFEPRPSIVKRFLLSRTDQKSNTETVARGIGMS